MLNQIFAALGRNIAAVVQATVRDAIKVGIVRGVEDAHDDITLEYQPVEHDVIELEPIRIEDLKIE